MEAALMEEVRVSRGKKYQLLFIEYRHKQDDPMG